MKNIISIFIASILLCSCEQRPKTAESPSALNSYQDSITNALNEIQAKGNINGFAVTIVNEEKVLYEKGFGFSDISTKAPFTKNTIQNIASISKTFIGIALLKAQEMGKLNLDDPISKYLDFDVINPNFPEEAITIRQLTTHTSSITDGEIYGEKSYILQSELDPAAAENMEVPEEFNPPSDMLPMSAFLKNVLSKDGQWYRKELFLNQPPGKLFEYTNIGATLAAYVIEVATGEPFNQFTAKHILQPLKMESSGWSFAEVDASKHTTLYGSPSTPLPFYSLITYPDGGMITSINDMGKYLQEVIKGYNGNGTLLTKASYEELFRPQLAEENFTERNAENPYNDEYNFGVFFGLSAKDYIGHTGGDPGVSSLMFFNTKTKVGRMLIINTDLVNDEAVKQFISTWTTLEEYELKL